MIIVRIDARASFVVLFFEIHIVHTKLNLSFRSGVPLLNNETFCRKGSAGFFASGRPNNPGLTDSFSMNDQHRVLTLLSFFLKCLSSIKTAEPAGQVAGAEESVTAF